MPVDGNMDLPCLAGSYSPHRRRISDVPCICGHQNDFFGNRLCNEHSIKGILVNGRKRRKADCMFAADRQFIIAVVYSPRLGKCESTANSRRANPALIATSQRLATLKTSSFSGFRIAIAGNRSGSPAGHKRRWISRSSLTRLLQTWLRHLLAHAIEIIRHSELTGHESGAFCRAGHRCIQRHDLHQRFAGFCDNERLAFRGVLDQTRLLFGRGQVNSMPSSPSTFQPRA